VHTPLLDAALLDEAIGELEAGLDLIDQQLGIENHEPEPLAAETGDTFDLRLKAGVMVEVNLAGHFESARLSWVAEAGRHLLLNIEGHDAPSMVTMRVFRRLLANGRARFIEESQLFERAVRDLLDTAESAGAKAG
jgi:hypothetical protein